MQRKHKPSTLLNFKGGLEKMLGHLAKEQGFTLMELLIAVGIIAVLAGVGVPLYLQLQTGAKATEANIHLDSVRTCQESYKMVNNAYLDCAAAPRGSAAVDETPEAWSVPVAGEGFDDIGFAPNASVRFAYAVGGADSTTYSVGAVGDTNGDGSSILYIATESAGPHVVVTGDVDDAAAIVDLNTDVAFGAAAGLADTWTTD
jgi:prepilin-type N-terminal cleavage/methylation domain-containing protein